MLVTGGAGFIGDRPATTREDGLDKMARWVRTHGPRQSEAFGAIEVTKNLPASWI